MMTSLSKLKPSINHRFGDLQAYPVPVNVEEVKGIYMLNSVVNKLPTEINFSHF